MKPSVFLQQHRSFAQIKKKLSVEEIKERVMKVCAAYDKVPDDKVYTFQKRFFTIYFLAGFAEYRSSQLQRKRTDDARPY